MIIKRIMILSALFSISFSINAASTAEDCAAITDDTKRLQCYDAFLKSQKAKQEESKSEVTQPEQTAPIKPAPKPIAPPKPTAPAEPEPTAEEKFGAEKLEKSSEESKELDRIESRAKGNYKMWERGLEVKLENGQVWEITESRSSYHKVKNPKVTIEKGMFGSYFLRIEGLNKGFRVERIK
ncbi:hypothetical protein [Kangiella sediminilitoris]|uniref:Lipoprotein n=1 Tax=Kangiella sediminilitoris TaxID=1144748 RepID=A0A1B3B9Q6_9GAMM|nr:hypothetical protein [Kangiella sediminilitoris]AOE49517.1 hypothetical protein KS2013_793 [Kangiella sediminilitoris]